MKKQHLNHTRFFSYTFFLMICTLCWSGCSNNFLKDEPVYIGEFTDTLYVEVLNGQNQSLSLEIYDIKNAYYQIRQYPNWLDITQMDGYFTEGVTALSFRIIPELLNSYRNNQGTMLISIKGYGLVSIKVIVEKKAEPEPEQYEVSFDKYILDFNTELSFLSLSMFNHSTNNTTWRVVNCPEWIQIETLSGSLPAYNGQYLNVTCNRANLSPGIYTGKIEIEFSWTSGKKITINITASLEILSYSNPADLIEIEGTVADALFCKQTDRLFITTRNPNRLLVYNSITGMSEVVLSKAPNCLTLSEDGKQIFIGHSGLVSYIDSSLQVSKTYEVDFNVFSLAYEEKEWLYLSPDAQYASEPLIYLNLNNGFISKMSSNNIGGKTFFKKIKGKPLMLCTRSETYPSGVIILDISNGNPGQERYWHEELGRNFWFSEDYKYVYGANGYIYLTPDFNTGNDLLPLGQFERSMYNNWIDHCKSTNSIWCAIDNYWEDRSYINRYHDSDYFLINTYYISNYATTINGIFNSYRTIPYYVFSDKAGKNVFVIKNVYNSSGENANAWSIETITF